MLVLSFVLLHSQFAAPAAHLRAHYFALLNMHFCANRRQRYCFFFIRARNLETFFVPQVSHPPSFRHVSAVSPLCLHHLSAMPPLSLRYASAVYYGKRTAKRRQKDGKRTAKGRNQKQREAGENPDSSPVSACFMLTTTISPPRLRIYNSTAAQHKSLLLSDTTKTAFASNF